jgi:hypothetical protein
MSSTAVKEEDLPQVPEAVLVNKPETIEDAIARIMELEMRLEDLSRAVEIASITRQFELLDGFKSSADDTLKNKILIEQPDMGEFKVTIVTDKDDAKT